MDTYLTVVVFPVASVLNSDRFDEALRCDDREFGLYCQVLDAVGILRTVELFR